MKKQTNFWSRFITYQSERFPIVGHGLMITAFTFSAISYSRISRGMEGFIDLHDFLIGIFTAFTLFLLLRIFDEFKDQKEDAKYRPYLPVPRGLVSLEELKRLGYLIATIQVGIIILFQPKMLSLYLLVIGYMLLMSVEFFVPKWLKKKQLIYITSHMLIVPLIDLYSSGLDWRQGSSGGFHFGIIWFMLVSYINGLVIEFGRKIRVPATEEEGVVSYSKMYGTRTAAIIWLILLISTALLAIGAANFAGYGYLSLFITMTCCVFCAIPALLFIKNPTKKMSINISHAASIWTGLMYLSLGAIPMIKNMLL